MDELVMEDDADIQIVELCRPGVVVPKEDRRDNAVDSLLHQIAWEQSRCGERGSGHRWAFLVLPAMGNHDPARGIWVVTGTGNSPPVNLLVCQDCNLGKTVSVHEVCPRCLAQMGPPVNICTFSTSTYDALGESATCPDCGYTIEWTEYVQ